jgi:cell division initiation protein
MSYSPVEIRHVHLRRSLFGYRRGAVDTVLAEIASSYESVWQERMDLTDRVDELEREISRHREVEELMRTTLLTAGTIVEEAHREARTITNDARREREILLVAARRVRTLLTAALDAVDDAELATAEDGPEGRQAA